MTAELHHGQHATAPDLKPIILPIKGMTCMGCAGRVERALAAVPGVTAARVNFAAHEAHVTADPKNVPQQALIAAVAKAGYEAMPTPLITEEGQDDHHHHGDEGVPYEGWFLLTGAVIAAPLLLPMMAHLFNWQVGLAGWLQFVLATPVQFILGWRFYVSGWKAARVINGNMDLLVAIGTSAAYFFSVWILINQNAWFDLHAPLYFEAAAVVIVLVRLGKWLEVKARRATGDAIRALMDLRPAIAHLEKDGSLIDIQAHQLQVGDIVLIRPGERIPLDGEVLTGESDADESLITGESMPVMKQRGDHVIAGAMNGTGVLRVKTLAGGEATQLARIIRLVREAQGGKTAIQRIADRISAIFVPIVLVFAAMTFLAWGLVWNDWAGGIIAAVSILVIACPCALGLATPAAIMAGTGVAARAGILIRDTSILERVQSVTVLFFDKTGTLTEGRPRLAKIIQSQGVQENEILALAAQAQMGSAHPLARAVITAAEGQGLKFSAPHHAKNFVGMGVMARIGDEEIMIGNRRLMAQQKIPIDSLESAWRHQEDLGQTVSAVASSKKGLLGLIAISDAIKPEARTAVTRLKQLGIWVSMITGDNEGAARRVADALGLDEFEANVSPEGKAVIVTARQKKGAVVAMVGDGVNDAPALAKADIGIAMGSGADVAMETAAMTLMRPNPALVADAVLIARRTRRKIYENLFWAFIYNIIGLPLAALGLLNPVIAGAAMALSSVSVLANALLLRTWRPQA